MAETQVHSDLSVEQWDANYFTEYVRSNRFSRYMGTTPNNVIIVRNDFVREAGEAITIPLVTRLKGSGVSGNDILEGREEALNNYGHKITAEWRRNGVVVTLKEEQKTPIAIRDAAKDALMTWSLEQLRGGSGVNGPIPGIIDALSSFRPSGVPQRYADASEATKDAWLAANSDRALFGAAKANNSSNDHSASLANVDATNDVLSPAIISLAKRMAKVADPHIQPIRVSEDEEWFVMFAGTYAFRDLKNNTVMQQANREAMARGADNPLFRDGDLMWDGVIIREVPEIPVLSGVGASSIDVSPNFLCGSQAVGVAWGRRPRTVTQDTDYEFRKGVAVMEMVGVEKLFFNGVQHGVVTVYTAAVADT